MKALTSDEIYAKIEEIVKGAEREIKLASAWLKGRTIEELLELKGREVKLEVILRASELQDLIITDDRVFRKIKEVGGSVYLSDRLHAKFIVADSSKAVVGSANFTEPGLSDLSKGNIEAGVFYDLTDDEGQIRELEAYFEKIKELSQKLDPEILGFVVNPVKTLSFEFLLLEDVPEQSYVEVRLRGGDKVLAKITSIYFYDMGFFANPFTAPESGIFAPVEDFRKIFSGGDRSAEWIKSALFAYTNKSRGGVKLATAKVVGLLREDRLDIPESPFPVGSMVYRVSEESLGALLKKTSSGGGMGEPLRVGTVRGSGAGAFIDATQVLKKHMLILGATGSGKSYFAGRLVEKLTGLENLTIIILDPHGEYLKDLISKGVSPDAIRHVALPDTLFPVRGSELAELIKANGFSTAVSGNSSDAKQNVSLLSKLIKPSLNLSAFGEFNLLEVLSQLRGVDIQELTETLEEVFGSEPLTNQPSVMKSLRDALEGEEKVVIFDFKALNDAASRVNLAGLIMQEVFNRSKSDGLRRALLLEEAHNFAPEVSYGDVSAGRDNLALVMARKIAAEGRKFNLGLITITQRPAQVSKYVLSQMNTQAMFKTMNRADLDAISSYVEFSEDETLGLLPSLRTGVCLLSGTGVPFPLMAEIE